ncbi:MAG: Dickkopf N-terminal cysteine-rich domain-containing protein, partial [Myxococcota bacterium]|nr:Dickkopf N-terminal cysteine-rich domain-containing protein [Myxococcota bacterium]
SGAKSSCTAVGMQLAVAGELNEQRHAALEAALAGADALPFRLADDEGGASSYSGFTCSRVYDPATYYTHGQYTPAYLGDWSTLGAGHPDLTAGGSLVDEATEWKNVVLDGSMTNPLLPMSRDDQTVILWTDPECPTNNGQFQNTDGQCQLQLDNSYYGGKIVEPITNTKAVNWLVLRGPNGQASCNDYDPESCHEAYVPALRVRWHANNPNKTTIPGKEGTVLFVIDDVPNVIIDGLLIEQVGGADRWHPLRAGYNTLAIRNADHVVIRNSYFSGVLKSNHIALQGVNNYVFEENEIRGIALDELIDRNGNRRFMQHYDVECTGDTVSSCPVADANCSCPRVASGGFGVGNGNNKPRGPNACDDPTVAINDFYHRFCDVSVPNPEGPPTSYHCRVCRVNANTVCEEDADCGGGSKCAHAFNQCYIDNGECDGSLYSSKATYDEVMALCANECDLDFGVIHSNTFHDFTFIETEYEIASLNADAGSGVCLKTTLGTPGGSCTNDDDCAYDAFCHDIDVGDMQHCRADLTLNDNCTRHAQCPYGISRCNSNSGKCEPLFTEEEGCSDSNDCALDLYCGDNNQCTAAHDLNEPCQEHAECLSAFFCNGSKCVKDATVDMMCDEDVQCAGTLRCISNTCQSPVRTSSVCTSHDDCTASAHCAGIGLCVHDYGEDSTCSDDSECLFGEFYCSDDTTTSQCVPVVAENDSCDKSAMCPVGTFCSDDLQCIPGQSANSSCDDDRQCAPGLSCIGGVCPAEGMKECTEDAHCAEASGFSCQWPCAPVRDAISTSLLETLSPYEHVKALENDVQCCYAWAAAPDGAFKSPDFNVEGLSDSGMQRNKSVNMRFYFAEPGKSCPISSRVPLEYCMPNSYATEAGKCSAAGVPNYDQISAESPSNGVAFNNAFRDIQLTDSAFDFGHRRSCDPSYQAKRFRIERNLIDGGNHKMIGMSHPSNGMTLVNNLFFSSPGYAYHAWWKMRMLHNSRLWASSDVITPWYLPKNETLRQMTSWEVGNHPGFKSCPNNTDENSDQKSAICTTYEHGFQYLNETSRFKHNASGSGLNVFVWNYDGGDTNTSEDAPDELVYRGVLFAMDSVAKWFTANKDDNDLEFSQAQYCGFADKFTTDSTTYTSESGITTVVDSLPADVYLAAAAFDPSSNVGADPQLLQWLQENKGESIEPASVCEAGSVQCAVDSTGFDSMITVTRDWYGVPRNIEEPTRGAFEYADTVCDNTDCSPGFTVTNCESD